MKKDALNVSVGQRIRQVRENMGYTRESFSELCGISDSFLSDVERGNKSLTTKTLYKICNASHASADFILFGTHFDIPGNNPAIASILSNLAGMTPEQRQHAANILNEYFLAVTNPLIREN